MSSEGKFCLDYLDVLLTPLISPEYYVENIILLQVHFFKIYLPLMLPVHLKTLSGVASPLCQEGQSERTFLIFPFLPNFFSFS